MRATPLRNSIDQPMRIARIAVYAYELSFAGHAFSFSRERSVDRESSTLVQVTTDCGLSGWGEACPLTGSYLPAFTAGVRAAISLLAPALIGADPRNLAEVSARMDRVLLDQAAAKSPLDIACWDILGQATDLPVATLLGGRTVERFPLYRAVPIGSPEEMLADVRAGWERGVRRFQLKAGRDPHTDAAAVRRILEFVGEDGVVVVDANGAWSVQDALIAVRLLEPLPVPVYLEQPCRTLDECAHVRRASALPMIYDECVVDARSLFAAVREGGAGGVNLKLGKVGGLTRARVLRDLAQALDTALTIEDTWGGDVATAAVSHLAASTTPGSLFAASFLNDATREHVAGHRPASADGYGAAPDDPGLGIHVEIERLDEPLMSVA